MASSEAASRALQQALIASATASGFAITISASDWYRWSTKTFDGARHILSIEGPDSSALKNWLSRLPELKLPMRGHLIADIAVVAKRARGGRADINVEALTVVEA